MNYELWKRSIQSIIDTIENGTIGSLKAIFNHTFPVKVVNPVKKVEVKGQVIVSNQKNLENKIKQVNKSIKLVKESIKSLEPLIKDNQVEITNLPEISLLPVTNSIESLKPEFKKIVDKISTLRTQLRNIYDDKRIKSVKVTNLTQLVNQLDSVNKAIKKLKLNVNVKPVVVPAPKVELKSDIDYKKIEEIVKSIKIPNQEKFDYSRFKKILEDSLNITVTSGGGGGRYAFRNENDEGTYGLVDDLRRVVTNDQSFMDKDRIFLDEEESGSEMYVGYERPNGKWLIVKYDLNSSWNRGRYASEVNNSSYTDYTSAWNNKNSLTYGLYSETI